MFNKIITIIKNKSQLTKKGLQQIINIKASMDLGLSYLLIFEFKIYYLVKRPTIKTNSIPNNYRISGFGTGDGNFYVSIAEREKGVQVQLVFSITQHIRDKALMNSLISYLGCGNIKHHEKNS